MKSSLKTEIARCMVGLETAEQSLVSRFLFPEGFLGFQGHFPGKSILPGICYIQCAVATVERARQRPVKLKEVTLAKYFAPVGSCEEITCTCSGVAATGEFTMKAVITKGAAKVSELKLKVVLDA